MDKKKLNMLLIAGAVCIIIVAIVLGVTLAGRSGSAGNQNGKDTTAGGDDVIEAVTEIVVPDDGMYNVVVKTEGGMFFAEIGVYIYTDSTMEELVWFDKTDENGIAEFTAEDATGYVVVLQDVPEGYDMQAYYYITGAKTEIILGTLLKEGVDLSQITYSLGDVIHDFSVTTPDGEVYKISELLDEKKAVILNFWYVQCGPCKEEFPYMNEAYAEYADKIEILAMNPVNLDDEEIATYKKDMGIDFPMMQCEEEWATAMDIDAYPTTVVIDRYGVISLIHTGSLPDAEIFSQLFEYFTADDYQQTVVEDIYDIVTTELSQGTMDNPFELGGILDFKITVRPNQVIYFNMYRVDGMNVRIEDPDAYAIYNDKTYYPENGVVGLKVHCPDTYTPAFVGIGNSGTEKKTFHVTLKADPGTYENPYTLKIGEFTAYVGAGNDQGVFYEYRAEKTGALTLQCLSATKGVKYSYYLQNMRTSENRNLEYDSRTDDEGNVTVSVNVEKGDRVLVCISTLPDASGTYPAGTFKMKAELGNSIAEDEQYYGISVVDNNLSPVSNVDVKLTCTAIEEIEGAEDSQDEDTIEVGDVVSLVTDAKGVASRKLRIGTYKVVMTTPSGYNADTTEYTLTKDNASIAFMLEKIVKDITDYTIKVVDSDGNPIAGAVVIIDRKTVETDENGIAIFEDLPAGTYEVVVQKDGYTLFTKQLAEGETSLDVKMEVEDEDSAEKISYTVVIDYDGTLTEDIRVQFMSGGVTQNSVVVDKSTKQAVAKLPKGTYTVELAFADNSSLQCYTTDLTLTETQTTITVKIDEAIDASSGENCESVYVVNYNDSKNAYIVATGANPVINMEVNEYNYFIFEPTVAGVYKFSTNNSNAELTYWIGSTFYCQGPNLDLESYVDNSFTLSIGKNSIGASYIMALKGAQSASLIIERIGDVDAELPYEVYSAKTTPTAYKYSGSSLPYFDAYETDSSKYELELRDDGYYYLKATGDLVYVDLDYSSLSMTDLVDKTGLKCIFYDKDGNIVRKVDYTECLKKYVDARDTKTGYYPLTEDLMTIIQNGGNHQGWWDSENPNYRFEEGTQVNEEIAWLFFCCSAGL
ncbi:MAG: carboxypeptidase regulatory-like domain-containing protein [Roseburia sp.]|nr:carboxypeptidase regulatory-like domain-containing protein [Roseburia sp.]